MQEMEVPWSLARIRVGNGEGFGQRKLNRGVLYDSDRRAEGPSTFFEINRGSLVLYETALPTSVWPLPVTARGMTENRECRDACDGADIKDCSHISVHPVQKRMDVSALVEIWLDQHRGVVIDCFGPGARSPNSAMKSYCVRNQGTVLMRGNDGTCAVAALVNAMAVLCGRDATVKVMDA